MEYSENKSKYGDSGATGLRRLSSISLAVAIISALILIVALIASQNAYHGYERYFIWIVIGAIGTVYGITSIPLYKALATITEAAYIYKIKNDETKFIGSISESEHKFKIGEIVVYKPLNIKLRIEELVKPNEYRCATIEDGEVKIHFYKEKELSKINW